MHEGFHVLLLIIPFISLFLFRNSVFDIMNYLLGLRRKKYVKSGKVDIGLIVMFVSTPVGVTISDALPDISSETIAFIIVIITCCGAFLLSFGVMDEWNSNKKD